MGLQNEAALELTQKMTPLMRQYWEVKNAHPDKVILFRMGDFYEMFHDDALTAAPVVGIALTKRNPKDETPMCGVPHHSAEGPVNKLLRAGHKVAICEQLEDPSQAKGIVKRGVTRILTPGMVYDPDQLPSDTGNYICSLSEGEIAFADASTGEAFYYSVPLDRAWSLFEILKPSEFILSQDFSDQRAEEISKLKNLATVSVVQRAQEQSGGARELLTRYISEAQGGMIPDQFEHRQTKEKFVLSPLAIKHLEVFENNQGEKRASLYWAIDRTKTSMGARQLRRWLCFPEVDPPVIEERLTKVETWVQRSEEMKSIRQQLALIGDMERRLGRLYLSNSNARDLLALAHSLKQSIVLHKTLSPEGERFRKVLNTSEKIIQTLREELPMTVREGGLIRQGISTELDEFISLTSDHNQVLQQIEQRERESSGIISLKVKYNAVFGYFIEVTHTHKDKVPKHYIRKQTLSQAERFTTDELFKLEEKILSAKSRRFELEFDLYNALKEEIKTQANEIVQLSHWTGELDALVSFAWLALEQNFVKPLINQKDEIILLSSRHPVIEQTHGRFVANDIRLKRGEAILLTGPNMAGKSTLMRQVAISSLLLQIGCFVPAREASLPIFNRILTRIGASDNLAEGFSTFMVEMKETAELMSASDSSSLVILDEIGRGTATFDGMALAQSILEHLYTIKRSTILFATHYHELASLESERPGIRNFHMQIRERSGEVKFLYQLTPGPAGKSYGIQVGIIAGLPKSVTQRASQILGKLENRQGSVQMDLFEKPLLEKVAHGEESEITKSIRSLDPNNLTPMSALLMISEWHRKLS